MRWKKRIAWYPFAVHRALLPHVMAKGTTVNIIGAGIGGITLALALQQRGIKANVFEEANALKPVGAGIMLANNAMQVFDQLSLKDLIEGEGNAISSLDIVDQHLRLLSSIDLTDFEKKYGCRNIAIHRGALLKSLAAKLEPKTLHLGFELESIERSHDGDLLIFSNGNKVHSQLTIGADGIHSAVRNVLFPHARIRDANQVCWRGIAETDREFPAAQEAWGAGTRFGFVQIAPGSVYWYALKTGALGSGDQSIEDVKEFSQDYHVLVADLIAKTKKDRIHIAAITDLKPLRRWHDRNICLIGDAAHATTPNMGQGACQAIEDARVLAHCLGEHPQHKAFEIFQKLRMPKVKYVVRNSWSIGQMAHWHNPVAVMLRNQLLRRTPRRVRNKPFERVFRLEKVS